MKKRYETRIVVCDKCGIRTRHAWRQWERPSLLLRVIFSSTMVVSSVASVILLVTSAGSSACACVWGLSLSSFPKVSLNYEAALGQDATRVVSRDTTSTVPLCSHYATLVCQRRPGVCWCAAQRVAFIRMRDSIVALNSTIELMKDLGRHREDMWEDVLTVNGKSLLHLPGLQRGHRRTGERRRYSRPCGHCGGWAGIHAHYRRGHGHPARLLGLVMDGSIQCIARMGKM